MTADYSWLYFAEWWAAHWPGTVVFFALFGPLLIQTWARAVRWVRTGPCWLRGHRFYCFCDEPCGTETCTRRFCFAVRKVKT